MEKELILKILRRRLALHLFFWFLFALSFSLGYFGEGYSALYILLNYFAVLAIYATYIYTILYFIYQYLAKERKQYIAAIALFIVLLLAATNANAYLFNVTNPGSHMTMLNLLPFYIFLAAYSLSCKIARTAYLELQTEIQLKQELLNQKEYFLRSQIHPHFLFNTLNNFYGLALDKAEELPALMVRLSNILRHQIYNSESSFILLQHEVNYLKDYVELEKIRHGQNLSFNFVFPEDVDEKLFVTPSILIVFLENAFKHSNNISTQLIEITGYLKVVDNKLYFELVNSYPDNTYFKQVEEPGIGLKNVRNRLEIMGSDTYSLSTDKKDGRYKVSLSMNLKNNA